MLKNPVKVSANGMSHFKQQHSHLVSCLTVAVVIALMVLLNKIKVCRTINGPRVRGKWERELKSHVL